MKSNLKLMKCIILCIALFWNTQSAYAIDISNKNQSSLSEVLNSDGTLKHGISGSFNLLGYKMIYGKGGKPVFISTATVQTEDEGWYPLGTGVDGVVYAIAVSGTDIYVGGTFSMAGNVEAKNIAKWDGNTWSALSSGVSRSSGSTESYVRSLAVLGTDLYVGGYFDSAGDIANTKGIAKWDGLQWSALGSGVSSGIVWSLVISGTDLYIGGGFTLAGDDSNIKNIARWDGNTWNNLGSGISNTVRALAVSGTDLYVGGEFGSAGGVSNTNYIAKWNGSRWSALTWGTTDVVNALAVSGSELYVGGEFSSAGGVTGTKGIAKWNGSKWSALGTGVINGTYVYAIAVLGTDVYVGGHFSSAGGVSAKHIAKWDGTQWISIGPISANNTTLYSVYAISVLGTDVYVGGNFSNITVGDPINIDPKRRIARYHTTTGTLPLQTIVLKAQRYNNGINLQWHTTQEQNVLAHEVQRAGENADFTTVVNLKANNTANASYTWLDNEPLQGNNYYRIKTVDVDGKNSNVSEVVKLTFNFHSSTFNLYPNPTKDKVFVKSATNGITCKLTDLTGKILQSKTTNGIILEFSLSAYPNGIYILQYQDGTGTHSQKVIKSP